MPRPSILSATERTDLLGLPETQNDLIRFYTFTESDLALIRQRRGDANRLGFAVQLCLLRYPGYGLTTDMMVNQRVLQWIADQIKVNSASRLNYAERDQTRREHLAELRLYLKLSSFKLSDFRHLLHSLTDLAMQTDKGLILATRALDALRHNHIILPALTVIERICSQAIVRANRQIYRMLSQPLSEHQKRQLDELLKIKTGANITWLIWLRQSPLKPNSRHMLEHIERLNKLQTLALPAGIGRQIHQNRLLKMAREGGQMTPQDLGRFENERRYATLVALVLESMATVTDELIDLHDRIIVKLFSTAKHKHQRQFQNQGKAINEKVRQYSKIGHALLDAKLAGEDPFAAIEAIMSWEDFTESIAEADTLSQPESFDHLPLISEQFNTLRRYTPEFLDVLKLRAAPAAQPVLEAIDVLRGMNADNARKVPDDAPVAFVKPRWKPLVLTDAGIDRRFYEMCALSELKNSLRSGDI